MQKAQYSDTVTKSIDMAHSGYIGEVVHATYGRLVATVPFKSLQDSACNVQTDIISC